MTNKTAIYPGTFDPMTLGHADIARRAARQFDRLIVAIAPTNRKATWLDHHTRLELAKTILAPYSNIEVVELSGLLTEFAAKKQAQIIIRGLRSIADLDYELQMTAMNRIMAPELETLFLAPSEQYARLSSTMVREIAALGGDISPFVPEAVINAWQQSKRQR